ncbi:hypothetical protein C0J52_24763, partial [Blattella germanica]
CARVNPCSPPRDLLFASVLAGVASRDHVLLLVTGSTATSASDTCVCVCVYYVVIFFSYSGVMLSLREFAPV